MTRSVFRYLRWTMGPETAPEAPEMVHELECMSCDAAADPRKNSRRHATGPSLIPASTPRTAGTARPSPDSGA